MATKVKGKIGKRIARRAKAGKSVDIGLGPGMASLAGKSAATKLAALAKRISAAKKAKGVRGNAEALRQLELKTKGKLSRPRPSKKAPPPKGSVSEAKAKRAALQALMDKSNKQAVKLKKEIAAIKAKNPGGSASTARADLVRRSNAQADRLAGKKPGRQPTTGMPARRSSGSGFNPKAAAEARKTPAKRAREARLKGQRK